MGFQQACAPPFWRLGVSVKQRSGVVIADLLIPRVVCSKNDLKTNSYETEWFANVPIFWWIGKSVRWSDRLVFIDEINDEYII